MIVRNYSHLSQAMRNVLMADTEDAPARATRQSTVDSLVALGFAIDAGNRWIIRTQAGKQAREHFLADVPAKIAVHLDKARDAGLTVTRSEDCGTLKSWTIGTPNPIDRTQIWLHWSPGARGGRVGVTLYYGPSTKRHARIKDIHFAIQDMSESLERHRQREAAKDATTGVTVEQAQAALGQGGQPPADDEETRAAIRCGLTVAQLRERRATMANEMVADGPGAVYDSTGSWIAVPPVPTHDDKDDRSPAVFPLGDPTRPGWFMVGQHIYDHDAHVHAEVVHVQHGANGNVEAVAVVTNGGYGGHWYWYGEKPGSIGGLDRLEGAHVGLTDRDRRPWPSHLRSVVQRVNMTLRDQMLSGWATTVGESADLPAHVVINLPVGLDPERHRILLARYIPYRVTVQARVNNGGVFGPTLIIRPKED